MKQCVAAAFAVVSAAIAVLSVSPTEAPAQEANACPVDGCEVRIVSAEVHDDEVSLVFEANFLPDLSRNHIHVWWGDRFTVEQVSNNAEPVHGVQQGDWHPTDAYPDYVTTGASSTAVREGTATLCVSAADRNHDILDVERLHCVSVEDILSM